MSTSATRKNFPITLCYSTNTSLKNSASSVYGTLSRYSYLTSSHFYIYIYTVSMTGNNVEDTPYVSILKFLSRSHEDYNHWRFRVEY